MVPVVQFSILESSSALSRTEYPVSRERFSVTECAATIPSKKGNKKNLDSKPESISLRIATLGIDRSSHFAISTIKYLIYKLLYRQSYPLQLWIKQKKVWSNLLIWMEALVSPGTNKHTPHTCMGMPRKGTMPYKVMKRVLILVRLKFTRFPSKDKSKNTFIKYVCQL